MDSLVNYLRFQAVTTDQGVCLISNKQDFISKNPSKNACFNVS